MFISFLHDYFVWHYTKAFFEIFHVFTNFLWFVTNFFSIPQLTKSFFAPWRRMTESLHKGFNFEELASYVIVGILSRVVGILMRSIILLLGLLTLIILTIVFLSIYVFWIFAPAFMLVALFYGIALMFA